MATFAMECNKHVAIEVPAAMSVEECWQLVDTAEKTRRHCIMLENCCYDPFALTTLNMARQGILGTIMHVEGAYIHDLRSMYFAEESEGGYHNHWGKDIASNIRVIPIPLMVWDLPARYLTFTGAIKWNTSFQCPPTKQA